MAQRGVLIDRACQACGKPFQVYASQLRWYPGYGTHCSQVCKSETQVRRRMAAAKPGRFPSYRIYVGTCAVCGDAYVSRRAIQGTTCSPKCRGILLSGRRSVRPARPAATPISYSDCARCGQAFVISRKKLASHVYCSKVCARRADHHHDKHRRREVVGRIPAYKREIITLRQIADRDGWRCHLCGKRVRDRPYAARPTDATLDHLVPVSDNGLHVAANVALAHNLCNMQRSTGGTVQLRLVG